MAEQKNIEQRQAENIEAAKNERNSIVRFLAKLGVKPENLRRSKREGLWDKYKDRIQKNWKRYGKEAGKEEYKAKYEGSAGQNKMLLAFLKHNIVDRHMTFDIQKMRLTRPLVELKKEIEQTKVAITEEQKVTPTPTSTPAQAPAIKPAGPAAAETPQETENSPIELPKQEEGKEIVPKISEEEKAPQPEKKEQSEPIQEKTRPLPADVEQMKSSGEKRDAEADAKLMKTPYSTAFDSEKAFSERYARSVTIDNEVHQKWVKSENNDNWIHINGKGREALYTVINQARFLGGLDETKKLLKTGTVSFEDVVKKAGYKSLKAYASSYESCEKKYKAYEGAMADYGRVAKEIADEQDKKERKDEKKIAELQQLLENIKVTAGKADAEYKKDQAAIDRAYNTLSYANQLLDIVGNHELFYYNEQTAGEVEEGIDSENQKVLDILNIAFPQDSKGPLSEETKRIITMLDLNKATFSKDTNYFEQKSSFAAAYDDVESSVLVKNNPGKTKEKLIKKFNDYIELALLRAGKSAELDATKITPEKLATGKLDEKTVALVRLGYILAISSEGAVERAALKEEKEEPSDPRVIQLIKDFEAKNPSIPKELLRKKALIIESRLRMGCMMGIMKSGNNVLPAGGFGAAIELGDGLMLGAGISGIIDPETHQPVANFLNVGVGKKFQIGEESKLVLGLGFSGAPGIGVGATAVFETPLTKRMDVVIGVGAGADALRLGFVVGGVLGIEKNLKRMVKADIEEKMQKMGYDIIENANGEKAKYDAIMAHPLLGPEMKKRIELIKQDFAAKGKNFPDGYEKALVFEMYEMIKDDTENKAVEDLDPGIIAGGGLLLSVSPIPVIPYITFNIGSSVKVIRLVDAPTEKISDLDLKEQLQKELSGLPPSAEIIDLGKSGRIAMDKEGRPALMMDEDFKLAVDETNSLELLNKGMVKSGIQFEEAAGEGKSGLLKINIGNSRNANINVHIDPKLQNALLVHDGKDFYLAISEAQNLLITRKEYKYPFMKDNAYRQIDIFIKSDLVSEQTLENTETAYLEKKHINRKQKGAIKETGIKTEMGKNNIVSYEEFLALKQKGDVATFKIKSMKPYKDATQALLKDRAIREASNGKEEVSRNNLEELVKEFYASYDTNEKIALKKLFTEYDPDLEVNFKKVLDDFEKTLADKKEKELTTLERTFFRNILMVESFVDIGDRSVEAQKKSLEKEMDWVKPTLETMIGTAVDNPAETPEIVDYLVTHMLSTDFNSTEKEPIDANTTGNLFVSLVGGHTGKGKKMNQFKGAARSLDYSGKKYMLLNTKEFKLDSQDPKEQKTARALLRILSPLDVNNSKSIFRSQLGLKLSQIIPFVFTPEDAQLYLDIARSNNPDIDNVHTAFFAKYKKLVEGVRAAELQGKKTIGASEIDASFNGVQIAMATGTRLGLFEKCHNPTIVGKENLAFTIPQTHPMYAGASAETRVVINSVIKKTVKKLKFVAIIPVGTEETEVSANDKAEM